jgi:hypothetical protein
MPVGDAIPEFDPPLPSNFLKAKHVAAVPKFLYVKPQPFRKQGLLKPLFLNEI